MLMSPGGRFLYPQHPENWKNRKGDEYRVRAVNLATRNSTLAAGVNGSGRLIRKSFNPPPAGWVRVTGGSGTQLALRTKRRFSPLKSQLSSP